MIGLLSEYMRFYGYFYFIDWYMYGISIKIGCITKAMKI